MSAREFKTARLPSSPGRGFLRPLLCMGLLLFTTAVFGQGSPTFTKADGLENWDHDFDTSKLPAGTYNIIVKGKDSTATRRSPVL